MHKYSYSNILDSRYCFRLFGATFIYQDSRNIHILIFLIQDIVSDFLGQRLFPKTAEIFIFSYLLFEILFHIFGGWLLFTKTAYVHKYSCSHIFLFEILVHILGWLLFICQDRVCA